MTNYMSCIEERDHVFLFNSMVGGGIVFDRAIMQYLDHSAQDYRCVYLKNSCPEGVKKLLFEKGLLNTYPSRRINETVSETNTDKEKAKMIGSLRLTLTNNCNCVCEYCYVDREYHDKNFLSEKDSCYFIERIIKMGGNSKYVIRFFGGEPMLYMDTISNVIKYCNEKLNDMSFEYIINTNLQTVTNSFFEIVTKPNVKVVVSLDSVKEINDVYRRSLVADSYYDTTVANLRKITKENANYVVAAVVTNMNRKSIQQFLELLVKNGVKNVGLNCARMSGEDILSFDEELVNDLYSAYIWGVNNGINVSGYWMLPFERIFTGSDGFYCGGLGFELDLRPDRKIYSCVGAKKTNRIA